LTASIGTALAGGQFARVPVINGITHDEELLFVAGLGITVSQGTNIPLAGDPTDPANYQANIAQALGVTGARAAAIAGEYPLSAYPSPVAAFSLLVSDASFACPALQVDRQLAARGVPAYAYQFNDDNAPVNLVGASLGLATHGTELPYLFDQPNAPHPAMLNADQQALAASMRTAWASFAASGNPSTRALSWPLADNGTKVLSFVPLQSKVTTDFAAAHHCSFWAAG
ncbi:MAG TPA: carboxylesterase family protein, partial [Streptosporangiaceae bacterium]|nr:carboxylesterase family protein [Streptosporangiaceae bacterium]